MKILSAVLLVMPAFLIAQQPATSLEKITREKTDVTTSPKSQELTVDNIIAMVQVGLAEDIIITRIRRKDKAFDLSAEDLITLKKAGINDAILRVMLDPRAEIKSSVQSIPPLQSPVDPVTPVVIQTPAGDLNDPMTPHDSGIYLYTKDRDGNTKMIVLERTAYQSTKTGGVFSSIASAATGGITKIRTRAVLPGARASIRTTDPSPVFYFYFNEETTGVGKSHFGITNLSSPNQFVLLKTEVKRSSRETIIAETSAFGGASGVNVESMVPFKSERIRPGLYKVVLVNSLQPGEYCFMASAIAGAYAAGAGMATDIFDFGVNPKE